MVFQLIAEELGYMHDRSISNVNETFRAVRLLGANVCVLKERLRRFLFKHLTVFYNVPERKV